mmetsp:Transcript_83568/g.132077  ORF Transcript_83568/g.132077 Transcript_83568/m.132077 type:complete len:265 (-) Transcript_83568:272-1066(-)
MVQQTRVNPSWRIIGHRSSRAPEICGRLKAMFRRRHYFQGETLVPTRLTMAHIMMEMVFCRRLLFTPTPLWPSRAEKQRAIPPVWRRAQARKPSGPCLPSGRLNLINQAVALQRTPSGRRLHHHSIPCLVSSSCQVCRTSRSAMTTFQHPGGVFSATMKRMARCCCTKKLFPKKEKKKTFMKMMRSRSPWNQEVMQQKKYRAPTNEDFATRRRIRTMRRWTTTMTKAHMLKLPRARLLHIVARVSPGSRLLKRHQVRSSITQIT